MPQWGSYSLSMTVVILCYCLFYTIINSVAIADTRGTTFLQGEEHETGFIQTRDEETTHLPTLTPYEKYKDLFHLSASNFTKVLQKKDPWIVIFHENGTIAAGWKTMAASLRGIVWVAVINSVTESDVLPIMGIDHTNVPPAVVFPYGTKKQKRSTVESVNNPLEAKNKAVQSIPDYYQHLKGEDIQSYLMDSFTTSPSRFPVLLMHSDDIVPPVFKALAIRFQKYYNFGLMPKPSSNDLSILGLQEFYFEFPTLLTMVTTHPVEPKMNAIIYKTEDMGEMNYPNLMRYLFYVNGEFRYLLPGDSRSNEESIAKMSDIKAIEEERFDFIDGRDSTSKPLQQDDKKSNEVPRKNMHQGTLKKNSKVEL